MVGQGVPRECLPDTDVDAVLTVARTPTGVQYPKVSPFFGADLETLLRQRHRHAGARRRPAWQVFINQCRPDHCEQLPKLQKREYRRYKLTKLLR
jgi:hypothetical protein